MTLCKFVGAFRSNLVPEQRSMKRQNFTLSGSVCQDLRTTHLRYDVVHLLGLLDAEDAGTAFLRNVGRNSVVLLAVFTWSALCRQVVLCRSVRSVELPVVLQTAHVALF